MSEKKQVEVKQTERNETRKFRYSNDESGVSFEFEIEVSTPEEAIAEIADFKELMEQSITDLTALNKEFVAKIEKPAKKEEPKKEDAPVKVVEEKQVTAS